jgi:predicted ATP-dependent protease
MFSMAFSRGRMIIQAMLALIGKLYDIERETRQNGLDAAVIKELRQQHSKPILDEISPQHEENQGKIICIERLGGLLKSYHRKAA